MKLTTLTALVVVLASGGGGLAQQEQTTPPAARQTTPPANQTMHCTADPRLPDSDQFAEALCPMVFHCNATVGQPPVQDNGPLGLAGDQLAHAQIDCGKLCVCQ